MADRADGAADESVPDSVTTLNVEKPRLTWPTRASLASLAAFVLLVGVGAGLWYPPAGFIAAGLAFLIVGVLLGWSGSPDTPGDLDNRITRIETLLQRAIGDG